MHYKEGEAGVRVGGGTRQRLTTYAVSRTGRRVGRQRGNGVS